MVVIESIAIGIVLSLFTALFMYYRLLSLKRKLLKEAREFMKQKGGDENDKRSKEVSGDSDNNVGRKYSRIPIDSRQDISRLVSGEDGRDEDPTTERRKRSTKRFRIRRRRR